MAEPAPLTPWSKAERNRLRLAESAMRFRRGEIPRARFPNGPRWTNLRAKLELVACAGEESAMLTGEEIQMIAAFIRLQHKKRRERRRR